MRIKIYPFSSRYYALAHEIPRNKFLKFLGFKSKWETITTTYVGAKVVRDQPLLFKNFSDAYDQAKEFTDIEKFSDFVSKQDEIYSDANYDRQKIVIVG